MRLIRSEKTKKPCPDCGNGLIEEEYQDIVEQVEFFFKEIKKNEKVLFKLQKLLERKSVSRITKKELQKIFPDYILTDTSGKFDASQCCCYFKKILKEKIDNVEEMMVDIIKNGKNTISQRCENCGYTKVY